MKTKRFLILMTILVAALALLTVSLAVASEGSLPAEAALSGGPSSAHPSNSAGFDVMLVKDDDTNENNLVLRDPNTLIEYHGLWLNWFPSSDATFPFQLEQVDYVAMTNNLVGNDIQILVYADDNGGVLTDATLVYTEVVSVQTQAGLNVFPLANPVVFNSPTDIIIGFSSIYADGGVAWPGDRFPYSMDTTSPQGDSYIAWMSTTAAPVDVTNLASFSNFGEIGALGLPANWQTRGYGNTIQVQPGIDVSKSPASQNVTTNGIATFSITVTNTGDVDLTNVSVVDPLVPNCDNVIGALVISATVSYSCQDVSVSGSYTNVVTATSELVTGGAGPSASASAVVNYTSPTSVVLSGFGGNGGVFSPMMLVAVLAVILGAGFIVRRKLTA